MNPILYNALFTKNIALMAKNNTEVLYNNHNTVKKNDVIKIELFLFFDGEFLYLLEDCLTVISFDYLYKNFIPCIP